MKVPFEEYLPDQPALGNPGSLTAHNVVPNVDFYGPMRRPVPLTDPLPGEPLGSAVFRDNAAATHVYAGTSSALYELSSLAWVDRSKAGAYVGDSWEFAQFSNNVIASNFDDPIQAAVHGSQFSDMSPTAPKAKHIAVVGRFLVCGYCDDEDGVTPNRVRWGPIDDPFGDWTPDLIDQDDFRDLREGGTVHRLFGGDYGIVLQEGALQQMSFVGGPVVHRFDNFAPNMGTNAPGSAVQHENMLFFYGTGGFHGVRGTTVQNIGEGKVNRTIKKILNEDRLDRFSVEVDPLRDLVFWYVPSVGTHDQIVAYNWNNGRFTQGDADDLERFCRLATTAVSIDDLSALYGGISIDDEPLASISPDSPLFKGSNAQIGAFNKSHELSVLEGAARPARLGTAEAQLIESRRSLLLGFLILVNGPQSVSRGRIGYRDSQNEDVQWTSLVEPNSVTRLVEHEVDSVFTRAEITIEGEFDAALGVDIPSDALADAGYAG